MFGKLPARFLFVIVVLVLFACSPKPKEVTSQPAVGMANPAAIYCEQAGNKYEIRTQPDGGQYGVCIFSDGSECPDFDYYEGKCKAGDYQVAPIPAQHPPRFEDQKYGFFIEADCGYSGWDNKVIFNCASEAGESFSLTVGYGWADEQIPPLDFGVDVGELQDGGTFKLLGQDITKKLLMDGDKVRLVAYGPNLEVGKLRLSIWLASPEGDTGQFEVTEDMQAKAETILSTFAFLNGEAPEVKVIP